MRRSALVSRRGEPVMVVERESEVGKDELLNLVPQVKDVLFHDSLPVDRRHNAKIQRDALGRWAEKNS